jgi:hypothetical protein
MTTQLLEFFHDRGEKFLDHVGLYVYIITHYWGRYEFAKSRGQIHLYLLAIIGNVGKGNGIYDQLSKVKDDKVKQAIIFAKWAREKFNMTAEVDECDSNHDEDYSPCKVRFSELESCTRDQKLMRHFCQIHKCGDYYLRKVKKTGAGKEEDGEQQKPKNCRRCRLGCGFESNQIHAIHQVISFKKKMK